jgi:transcriptional regulator with XRE-family HTH domain
MKIENLNNLSNKAAQDGRSLSELIGISKSHLWRIKNGKAFPSLNVLIRIYALSDGRITPNDFYLPAIQKALETAPEKYIIKNPKITALQEVKDE